MLYLKEKGVSHIDAYIKYTSNNNGNEYIIKLDDTRRFCLAN